MTITLSQRDFWELFEAAPELSSSNQFEAFESLYTYPEALGKGYWRDVELRDGIDLAIAHYHFHTDVVLQMPERPHPLEFVLLLEDYQDDNRQSFKGGRYELYGCGIAPKGITKIPANGSTLAINVHIDPDAFQSWWQHGSEALVTTLKTLFRRPDQEYYTCSGVMNPAMHMAVQHMLHCPHQGFTKRMYLESKVWELMALLLDDRQQQPTTSSTGPTLKSADITRIHQARDILLQQLENPPSLLELSRQVGLNDCTLKRGFRQVFGTTAFGLLHDFRLEQARQMLDTREFNVSEVARAVGIANRSYFASAFRKKFGLSPREYLSSHKSSA